MFLSLDGTNHVCLYSNRLVQKHKDLQKRFEESSKLLDSVTAQATEAAARAKVAESQIQQLSPSAGERILLATPDVVFLTVVALCTPQTLAALSRSCRAVHGRVGYAVRVARTSRDLDLIESSSSSLIMPKITQAAKNGILRAVHAIHAWSPHMGSSNFAPQKSSVSVSQDDTFSLGEAALTADNADTSASGRGRTGSTVSGANISTSTSSAGATSLSSPATSVSGGIFGFGARRPASTAASGAAVSSSAPPVEKDSNKQKASGGGLFVSPSKPDEGSNSNSSSGGGGAVDYKKVEELMIKLKTANANLLNLKRTSDDMRMKLETAEGVKKHLAQQVRQLEDNIAAAVRDKDTALHEKSQNLEVIRFLDDRVATLEAQLESSTSASRENVSIIEEKDATINGLQLRIAYLEEDVKKSKAVLADTKAHMVAADARVADAEARAQALESLAMNLSPDILLDSGGTSAPKTTTDSTHIESIVAPLRNEIEHLKGDRDRLNTELKELKSTKRDVPRETAVWTDERGEVPGLKIEINRTRKERDDITKQRDELVKQEQALTKECDLRKSKIDSLEKEVESLTQKLAESASIAASKSAEKESISNIPSNDLASNDLASALDQLRSEHAAESQSWKQARTLLAKEVKKLRGELADLQARLGVSETNVA
jgi:predicted  nucleic acid-binding Zn-ribbon protein